MIGLVWSNDRRPIAFGSRNTHIAQGSPNSFSAKSGVDVQHANDGPALIEERGFLTVRPEIGDGAGEFALEFGNDDFSARAEIRGFRQAGKHRRPVAVVVSKL